MPDQQSAPARQDLLDRCRERHAALLALVGRLSDADLTRPGVSDDWSVKDHLAHVTWWEQRVLRVLRGEPDPIDAVPPPSIDQGIADESEDESLRRVNAYVHDQTQHLPPVEVRRVFDASYGEMLQLIAAVPDVVLDEHYDWIVGNSASH